MNGSRAPVTAAAVAVSLFVVVIMMNPFSSVSAAPQQGSREADMEFLEYLGTFEAGGEVLDPLAFEQLETDKKREKPVKKKQRSRGEERSSEKDAGNE